MYTISEISQFIGAKCVGHSTNRISSMLTDSRSLCFPENTLFFALKTTRRDGHEFIPNLYKRGVRCFVVSEMPKGEFSEACFLLVDNTLHALQMLARRHREHFHIPVVGIAGSNGKTTVKEWLYQMLSPNHSVARTPRSYNSQIGVPLSVWGLWNGAEMGIFEAAISQPGEMETLREIIQPTIGIFTCLGEAHQENFSSMEHKCREKLGLFTKSEALIYLSDNAIVDKCVAEMEFGGKLIPCPATGNALQDNVQLCRALCQYMGMSNAEITERASMLQPVSMRLEVLEGNHGCTIINDTYNSDLNSLDIALDFMNRRVEAKTLTRTVILSDIEQSGLPPAELYARVAKLLASRGVDFFIGIGHEIAAHKSLFEALGIRTVCHSSTGELTSSNTLANLCNSLIVIKGAHSFHFDEVCDLLVKKVHETILEVNLKSIVDNLNHYREQLQPQTRIICMVKADAYGAGAIEISKTLQEHNVHYLAVAVADEGVTLRKAGITTNIIVMNPEMNSLSTLFKYHLEPEVYSFRLLNALIDAARKEGLTEYPIHLKIDTGMRRLGFNPDKDIPHLTEVLSSQSALRPSSVFTHFVGSDADEFDDFSAQQYNLFTTAADSIQAALPYRILRHICNSAGITHFPQRQLDMVRLGIGLYGVNARNNQIIHNVSTLKTTILQIRDVKAGESVGYSRRTFLNRDSRIATLPIGYADGLNRLLGNRNAYCLVNGKKAPYVGNICMDVCMIDVTDIACSEGDTAIIFGNELPVTALSDAAGTIPYEVLTGVSPRVKRIYYKER
ncbi:MAG: alanine racemase [Bacteroidaceae bacterium]|nr:alanine racemase [Bacteroidaceae bacterium]